MFLLTLQFHRHIVVYLDTLSGPELVTRILRFISATNCDNHSTVSIYQHL